MKAGHPGTLAPKHPSTLNPITVTLSANLVHLTMLCRQPLTDHTEAPKLRTARGWDRRVKDESSITPNLITTVAPPHAALHAQKPAMTTPVMGVSIAAGSNTTCLMLCRRHVNVICTSPSLACVSVGGEDQGIWCRA